ncbi:MAG TPA: FlgD immunoglobulin-like domain containing protein, partial [Candidatus Saccharimonadales bacterium]|nr:FlgD immunoglobulin-like domain containing protein [Candidatus Saccharimonadales bacterium]
DTLGWIGNYPIEKATASGGADAIVIMGYDYRSATSGVAGSIAPMRSSMYDITDTIAAYKARVPASKLILGVPYYGRAWSTLTDDLHAKNVSGTKYGSSATANYDVARQFAADHGRHYDTAEAVAWTAYKRQTCTKTYGCVTAYRQLYYDDAAALKKKYDLVNSAGLRGIGIWALGYDGTRTELYQAIKDKFITDSGAPTISASSLSTSVISPNGDGRLDTTTAKLTASGLVKWGYKVQPLIGSSLGSSIRSGSQTGKSPSFTWNGRKSDGTRAANGRYRLSLWVADASDNRSSRAWTVTVDTKAPTVTTSRGLGFFSPDGNGHNDTTRLAWTSSQGLHGTVRILDRSGTSRRLWTFDERSSWATTWTGRNDAGTILPDGRYTFRVNGRDRAGNLKIVDKSILIDRTIKLHKWSDYSFDPRDGQTSRMTVSLRRSARVTVTIYLGSTRIRRIWTDKALAAGSHGWTWNGKTSGGTYVKAGTYRVVVLATSTYGTTRWTKSVRIQVH